MTDSDTAVGMVSMFNNAGGLYWVITIYSILVGAAMTYVGRQHIKKLLFFVGAFSLYVPMHFFASEAVSILVAILGGIVMVFCYPVFVFIVGTIPLAAICAVCGVQPGFFTMLLSIACGVTALIYRKHIVIPVSAMSGSLMLAFGLTLLFKGIHPALFIILFVLFMASGIFIQYKSAKDLLELGQNLTHLVSEQYKKYAPKKNLNEDGKEPEATK